MKTVYKVLVAVVLIVIILAITITFFIDTLIRRGVETAGGQALGVEVELSGADLSVLGGQLDLSGLRIANPEGFKADSLFEMARAQAAVSPSSLLQDNITIERVTLDSPSLTIEHSARGTNMSQLLKNIEGEGREQKEPEKEAPEKEKPEKTYTIKMLRITGAKATFDSFLTAKAPVTVALPDIEMENISSADGKGLVLAQVFRMVLVKMIETAFTAGEGTIPVDMATDMVDDLSEFVPELGDELTGKAKGLIEKGTEGLRKLFNRR